MGEESSAKEQREFEGGGEGLRGRDVGVKDRRLIKSLIQSEFALIEFFDVVCFDGCGVTAKKILPFLSFLPFSVCYCQVRRKEACLSFSLKMFLKIIVCHPVRWPFVLKYSQENEKRDREWNATHTMHHQGEGDRAKEYQINSMTFVRMKHFLERRLEVCLWHGIAGCGTESAGCTLTMVSTPSPSNHKPVFFAGFLLGRQSSGLHVLRKLIVAGFRRTCGEAERFHEGGESVQVPACRSGTKDSDMQPSPPPHTFPRHYQPTPSILLPPFPSLACTHERSSQAERLPSRFRGP